MYGLLLLTNNGKLKRHLELPINKIERNYKVKIYGNIKNLNKKQLSKGVTIKNIKYHTSSNIDAYDEMMWFICVF